MSDPETAVSSGTAPTGGRPGRAARGRLDHAGGTARGAAQQASLREHNLSLVLRAIVEAPAPTTRARLASGLGVTRAMVYGHSWGTLVALALALEFPTLVRGLVLGSGYYYPTVRADVFLFSPPAIPVIGDAMRYTISPLAARAILPGLIEQMFAPAAVPERFDRLFPKELMLRPSQLRAAAEDAALMTPSVAELEQHYRELTMPVTIITGADDQISDVGRQSARLHRELADSEFIALPGLGHMIHHLAPDAVVDAIDRVAKRSLKDDYRVANKLPD